LKLKVSVSEKKISCYTNTEKGLSVPDKVEIFLEQREVAFL
jgi:hypothetical protein